MVHCSYDHLDLVRIAVLHFLNPSGRRMMGGSKREKEVDTEERDYHVISPA